MNFNKKDHAVVAWKTKADACGVAVCAHIMLLFDKCVQAFIFVHCAFHLQNTYETTMGHPKKRDI